MSQQGPRVLALVADRSGPVVWRIMWPFTALEKQGYGAYWAPLKDNRAADVLPAVDAIVLPRLAWRPRDLPGAERWIGSLHNLGKAVILEMDDDLLSPACLPQTLMMGRQDGKTDAEVHEARAGRIRSLTLCDGVTVTTPRLATVLRQYTDKPVCVVPNAIDLDWWQMILRQVPRDDPRLTIGWAGGRRLDHDTALMAEAWRRVAARYPEVAFKISGYHDPQLLAVVPEQQLILAPWAPLEVYAAAYAHVDIGTCPLADAPFNRTKSPIKAFEWAAVGAAVVASPTVYSGVLQDGKYGLLAETTDDWEAALVQLIEDSRKRRELATRWAKRVREQHSLAVGLHRWPDAWAMIVADFHARQRRHSLVLAR